MNKVGCYEKKTFFVHVSACDRTANKNSLWYKAWRVEIVQHTKQTQFTGHINLFGSSFECVCTNVRLWVCFLANCITKSVAMKATNKWHKSIAKVNNRFWFYHNSTGFMRKLVRWYFCFCFCVKICFIGLDTGWFLANNDCTNQLFQIHQQNIHVVQRLVSSNVINRMKITRTIIS